MNKFNFVFWGTPDVASETLEILKENGYMPSLIITAPDKPQGRKMLITPPPVKIWAIKNNIPYIQPEKLNREELDITLRTLSQADEPRRAIFQQENMRGEKSDIELFLVVAYGKIIPEEILNIPSLGSINIHYSLLPKYRGASPVESAILNGDNVTGVSIQKMVYKMDAGPIIAEEKIDILPDEKAFELKNRLIKIGGNLLVNILPKIISRSTKETKQNEEDATFCKKIKKEDGLVNLETDPQNILYNKFRAYSVWPRTFFFEKGKRIIITDAVLENNQFTIKKVLPEGKKEIKFMDFLKSNI